jgi:5-methylcytosine-specific restriction endonuclease McrA
MPTKPASHAAQAARQRPPKKRGALATYQWQRFSELVRKRHPLCMAPFHRGPQSVATAVHHILPRSTHPHLTYSVDNCCPVCAQCHGLVEGMYRKGVSTASWFVGWQGASE